MSHALEFVRWLRAAVDRPSRVTGEELVGHWSVLGAVVTPESAVRLSQSVAAAGFAFEPDVRFSGHLLRPADRVLLFKLADAAAAAPSTAYLAAAAIARLGVIVASADGAVVREEQTVLREHTADAFDLDAAERQRLAVYVEWLLDTPISLDAVEREAAGLDEETRLRIGTFLVDVAVADHRFTSPERWILSGSFALLGLTPAHLEVAIAARSRTAVAAPTNGVLDDLAVLMAVSIAPTAIDPKAALRVARREQQTRAVMDEMFGPEPSALDIRDFEAVLAATWSGVDVAGRAKAGSLLALVPNRERWQVFLNAWRGASLGYWLMHAAEFPHAIAVLFGGFAFFEYEETSFWPHFERDLGWTLTEVQRTGLRDTHERAILALGLEMVRNASSDRLTVGSSVHHIGVPLSLWADFLAVADHALRQPGWQGWTSDEWQADVIARCGPRTRLRNFLIANEVAARETIAELGDIREYAEADASTTIEDLASLANVQFLRDEYFDEIPETAEFFRPDNLLSLFAGRYFLRYDDESSRLQVHLPRVDDPAGSVWHVGDHQQAARREPAWMTIDSDGFERWVDVHLDAPAGRRTKRIAGIGDWGLYDQRREAFLDLDLRRVSDLRMGDYVLVSARPLTHMTRRGFLGEFPENQGANLEDGSRCFVTRLSPASPEGSLHVRWVTADGDLREHLVTFRTRLVTRSRTMVVNGAERPMPDPSLPWYFLRPGPYPVITYQALSSIELTKMNNQGSASAYQRLRRYTEEGVITARPDGAWMLGQERARVVCDDEVVEVWLLGRPSSMYALGREEPPLSVEIVGDRGMTYLRATWPAGRQARIRERVRRFDFAVET